MRVFYLSLAVLLLASLAQAFLALYGFGLAEDSYVHAEIARIISNDMFYPVSYEPLAPVALTYPPLFHYLSLIPLFFSGSFVFAVNFMGYLAVLAFPAAMFLLGSLFGYRVASFSAIFSVIIAGFAHVYFFGEFPQVLAMVLLPLFIYFYAKKKYYVSGSFLGLAFLSHVFVGPFAYAVAAFLLAISFVKRNFVAFKLLVTTLPVSFLWLHRYLLIVQNALLGRWHNTVNYGVYPGFVGLAMLSEYAMKLNPVLLIFSFIGIFLVFKTIIAKRLSAPSHYIAVAFLFLTTLGFTVYHFPPFQLKMLDLLTIPVVICAAIAADKVLSLVHSNRALLFTMYAVVTLFVSVSFVLGPFNVMSSYKESKQYHLPNEFKNASAFLKDYDANMSRIIVVDDYRRYGKSELIASRLSGKLPVEATISDLEYYTPDYRQRLSDRKKIIEFFNSATPALNDTTTVTGLLEKHGIRYVFAKTCRLGKAVFENNVVRICQV